MRKFHTCCVICVLLVGYIISIPSFSMASSLNLQNSKQSSTVGLGLASLDLPAVENLPKSILVAAVTTTRQAEASASGRIGSPDMVVGANGSVGGAYLPPSNAAGNLDELALPPTEAPIPDVSRLRAPDDDPVSTYQPVTPPNNNNSRTPAINQKQQAQQAKPATSSIHVAKPAPAPAPAQVAKPAQNAKPMPAPAQVAKPAPTPTRPAPAPAPESVQVAKPAHKPTLSEKAAYDQALRTLNSGKRPEGMAEFRQFLQDYPNSNLAANAEYWIGEGFYAQGKYQEALEQFRGVANHYPKHHKSADALLKAGITSSRLGDKTTAQQLYKEVVDRFPNTEAAGRARSYLR